MSFDELQGFIDIEEKAMVDSAELIDLGKLASVIKKNIGFTFEHTRNSTFLSNQLEQKI